MPGSGMEGDDEYGEEVMEGAEFSKIKRDKVFVQIDYNRRKTKIVATLGYVTISFFFYIILVSIDHQPRISKVSLSCWMPA